MALVAELCHYFVLPRSLHEFSHLMNGMREGFLAINVLAALHCRHRHNGVAMVRYPNRDRVDLLVHRIEHFPEIIESFGSRKFLKYFRRAFGIDITKGDHVVARSNGIDVGSAHAAATYRCNVELLAGW